ncbi:amidase [Kineosporia mesophila]|uniref:Amidase n=1 Tax=Kineosporia mesophila TaxID=566012 RepID=A0ABP6ZHY2_9ACTN|nr:hypothetical protein [Kineosporia mesophila]
MITGEAGTGAQLAAGYAAGDFTPLDVATASIRAAEADQLNAIASIDADKALIAAEASTRRYQGGTPLGPLDGVPITFKDSFHITGLPRWHGTAVNPGTSSTIDAAPVRRAREAGMIVVAKTTMPDFAMLMAGLSSRHGVIRNAWDRELSPGGSSSGAPGSVVTGVAPIAVGTDMIGSVRLPAALSGLASIKPTQGRIAYDPAGDYRSAGPMARTVEDLERALTVLGQHDPVDLFALPGRFEPTPPPEHLKGRTIGVLRSVGWGTAVDEPTDLAVRTQADVLADLGAEVTEIPELPVAGDDYETVYWFMIYHGLPDYLGAEPARRAAIHPVVGAMLEEAFGHSAVRAAVDARRMAAAIERVRTVFAPFDHVLSPALPIRSFPAVQASPDPLNPVGHMGFACWPNRLGTPAGTVPVAPGPGGPPVSVQVTGRRFDDAGVLGVLRLLERARRSDVGYPPISQ